MEELSIRCHPSVSENPDTYAVLLLMLDVLLNKESRKLYDLRGCEPFRSKFFTVAEADVANSQDFDQFSVSTTHIQTHKQTCTSNLRLQHHGNRVHSY